MNNSLGHKMGDFYNQWGLETSEKVQKWWYHAVLFISDF